MRVIVTISENDSHKAAGERLRELDVHLLLILQVDERTQAKLQGFKFTRSSIGVFESLHIEVALELYQVDILVLSDLAEIDDLGLR